jgi:7-dehydrocholesterol reductase
MAQSPTPSIGFAHTYQTERVGPRWLRQTVVPALLITVCPPTALLLHYTHTELGGSLSELFARFGRDGVLATLGHAWGPYFFGTPTAWAMIGVFAAVELTLMRLLPGKEFRGPSRRAATCPSTRPTACSPSW